MQLTVRVPCANTLSHKTPFWAMHIICKPQFLVFIRLPCTGALSALALFRPQLEPPLPTILITPALEADRDLIPTDRIAVEIVCCNWEN